MLGSRVRAPAESQIIALVRKLAKRPHLGCGDLVCRFDSDLGHMLSKLETVKQNLSQIKIWESEGKPLAEVARILEMKYDTLSKHLKILGETYQLNPNRKGILHKESRKTWQELLVSNCSNSLKRKRLIEDKVKEEKCEICGLSEWMGKPIPLELHHKDLNHYNNDINNLQILCANCHMQAHNYCNN